MRHTLLLLSLTLPLAAGDPPRDAQELAYLVAALDDPHEELAGDAQRQVMIAGPAALPLLRAAAEDELARLAGLLPRIDRLVAEMDDDDYATREAAEKELIEVGAEALPALRQAVERGSPEQVARAREAMARIGAAPPLSQRFLSRLAEAMGAAADEACAPLLLSLARQSRADVFVPAMDGLLRLSSRAARDGLRALADDANLDRRWTARAALLVGGETPPGSLVDFLQDWPAPPVRGRVASALRSCTGADWIPVAVKALLREQDAEVRTKLVDALACAPSGAQVTTHALSALAVLPCAGQAHPLLLGLLREPTPEVAATLQAALKSTVSDERLAAVAQAARLFGARAKEWILPMLADPDDEVRHEVILSLDVILRRDAEPFRRILHDPAVGWRALLPLLAHSPGAERVRAVEERWGDLAADEERRVESLVEPLDDPALEEALNVAAEDEAGHAGGLRCIALQVASRQLGPLPPRPLSGEPLVERLRAIRALDLSERRAALIAALKDEVPSVSSAAVRWCIVLDADGLEEEVYPLLYSTQPRTAEFARLYLLHRKTDELLDRVRRRAAWDPRSSAPALLAAWEGRPATQTSAAESVTPPQQASEALDPRGLTDPDPDVRRRTWQSLAAGTAHLPDGVGNDLLPPIEAREAWERWLAAHRGATRSEMIDAALRERRYGEGVEGRIRALTEGPWFVAAAVLKERGREDVPPTPEMCLDEAARWRASLR